MSNTNKDIQPYGSYDKHAGLHIRRPFSDEQRAVDTLPLCGGNRYEPFKQIAEGEELGSTWPYDVWCEKCREIQRGVKR